MISEEQARTALRELFAVRAMGLREPLLYAPYSAWCFVNADNFDRGVDAARKQWHGSGGFGGFAEGQGDALRQVLRGCDPFADDDSVIRFADVALTVFVALRDGVVHGGVDPASLAGLARPHEPEDSE